MKHKLKIDGYYEIDFDKIKTIDDIVLVMKSFGISYVGEKEEWSAEVKHIDKKGYLKFSPFDSNVDFICDDKDK